MNRNFIEWTIGGILMIYGIYEGWSYTGLYKLIAETQLDVMGSYSIKLAIVLEMGALVAIWWGILKLLSRLFGLEPGRVEKFILKGIQSTDNQQNPQKLRQQAKRTVFIGLFLLLVVSAAAFAADRYWQDPPLTALVLGQDTEPQSSYVEIEGVVQPQLVLEYADKSTTSTSIHYVIPLTSSEWKEGDPLQYFIDTGITSFQDVSGKFHNYNRELKPFRIKHKFYVDKEGVEGMIREEYKRNNIPIKEPHYELKSSRAFAPKDVELAWILAAFFITICTLGAALGSIVGARRIEKAQH
jgi:hypothetical protein